MAKQESVQLIQKPQQLIEQLRRRIARRVFCMTVCILFDGGSRISYITDNVSRKLSLKSANTETLHLNTFGKSTHWKQRCEIVSLPIRTNDDEYVTALNFPIICSPLTERAHLQDHPHLQELELADSAESLNSIDILIGWDNYWEFVAGESIRGDFGPTGVKSKLGWLLSGPTNYSQNKTNVVSNLVITGESFSNGAKSNLPQSNNYGMCVTVIAFKNRRGSWICWRKKKKERDRRKLCRRPKIKR